MSKCLFAVAVGLCLSSQAAFGQATVPVLAGDATASAELAKIVAAAESKGLPVNPILAKARYAIVVHASPSRIVAVARDIAARLEVARDALQPRPNPIDIEQGEIALSYNVPRAVLTAMRRASPPESSLAVPLGALSQLVASGVSVKRASEIVTSLMKHGATGQQLASFSYDVDADVQRGGRPDDALTVRMRGLTAALAPVSAATADAFSTGLAAPGPAKPKKP